MTKEILSLIILYFAACSLFHSHPKNMINSKMKEVKFFDFIVSGFMNRFSATLAGDLTERKMPAAAYAVPCESPLERRYMAKAEMQYRRRKKKHTH